MALLPLRDSYDFEFTFGWEKGMEQHIKPVYVPNKEVSIKPLKRNGQAFTQELRDPKVWIKLIQTKNQLQARNDMIQLTSNMLENGNREPPLREV